VVSKSGKRIVATLEVCNEAAELLKSAGFVLTTTSMRSEATYYKWPGHPGVIRIATHKFSGGMIGLDHVLACLTFPPYKFADKPDHIIINPDKVRTMVAMAIGYYFLNPKDTSKSTYDGPNPKNDR
jgi:hypothetical protein